MNIAEFQKVSEKQFAEDIMKVMNIGADEAHDIYERLKLPARATQGSAGYDFTAPCDLKINAGESILIPTGIRARIDDGWVLLLFPRSGLGFKYRFQLDNSVGVIDADYYSADNEGHIMAKMTNDNREGKVLEIKAGKGFMQGVFVPFGTADATEVTGKRRLGFGSTDKEKG